MPKDKNKDKVVKKPKPTPETVEQIPSQPNEDKKNSSVEALTAMVKADPEGTFAMMEKQQKDLAEKKEAEVQMIVSHEFSTDLSDTKGLTRGERKGLKKDHQIDTREFDFLSEEDIDTVTDYLLESRDIQNQDSLSEGELSIWVKYIMGRANDPVAFEGK